MLSGMGPWLFACIAFICIFLLVWKLLSTIIKHSNDMKGELGDDMKDVKNVLNKLATVMEGMWLRQQRSESESKSKSDVK